VLTLGFLKEDFDLWLVGREIVRDPSLLFIGPKNFYRPANAWLFAAHQLLFGPHPWVNHLTTLALHLLCGGLLWRILGRFNVPVLWRAVGTFFWLTSPFAFEPTWLINVSYNDLTMAAVWLGLAALWPAHSWSLGRAAGLAALALASMLCKESWIILPALAVMYELTLRRTTIRIAAFTGAIAAIPVAVYLAAYVAVFAERLFQGGYAVAGIGPWLKVPHIWSTFWGLTPLQPADFPFGAPELAGTTLLAACMWIAITRRDRLMALGLALFVLPLIPVLPVPFLPPRYTAAPHVGFTLAAIALALQITAMVPRRRLAVVAVALVAAALTGRQLVLLHGDLRDVQRLDAAHQLLVAQAEAFVPNLPDARLLICLRLDASSPLRSLQAAGPYGMNKTYYLRPQAPYDLIHWEALLTFALSRRGTSDLWVRHSPQNGPLPRPWAVIAHQNGRIVQRPPSRATPRAEIELWRQRGTPVRVIVRRATTPRPGPAAELNRHPAACLQALTRLP
jgi:hypothetical protein